MELDKAAAAEGEGEGAPTPLKVSYALEIKAEQDPVFATAMDFLIESITYEDIPNGLAALKEECERAAPSPSADKVALADLQADFVLLATELQLFGGQNLMPTRAQLRAERRHDLVKAVESYGGFYEVAKKLGWDSAGNKLPRGYWQDLDNVRLEMFSFMEEHLLEPGIMPTHSLLESKGRSDMARMMRKHWGGQKKLADTLGLLTLSRLSSDDRERLGAEWRDHLEVTRRRTEKDGGDLYQEAAESFGLLFELQDRYFRADNQGGGALQPST